MNKKANLLGEYTLKIIIAVISLLLLLTLLFSLYSTFSDEKNFTRAKESLERLREGITGSIEMKQSFILLGPENWKLISYVSGNKPQGCSDYCLCICQDERSRRWKKAYLGADNQIETCEIRGICENYVEKIEKVEITLEKEQDIEIVFENEWYTIREPKEDEDEGN